MKVFRFLFGLSLLVLLIAACKGAPSSTPTPARIVFPTAIVPPIEEIDAAIERWQKSGQQNYFLEIEERTSEKQWKARLVVVNGQVRAAQMLIKDANNQWGQPIALPSDEARNYTIDSLLQRVRRDSLGQGTAPFNIKAVFDLSLGFPSVVHAEALPSYDAAGVVHLNRQYSYDLVVSIKALLDDTFDSDQTLVLTLTRSGSAQAWCDHLRIFADGSSIYSDDCRNQLLKLALPAKELTSLQTLLASFSSLEDTRYVEGGMQQLVIRGSGQMPPTTEQVQAAWELAIHDHALLSEPIGLGLILLYTQSDSLYGYDVFKNLSQEARLNTSGVLHGVSLSADQKTLAFSDDKGLSALDLETGKITSLLPPAEDSYYKPRSWASSGYLLVTRVPANDANLPELGWVSLSEARFHAIPLPEGSVTYGCDTGVAWSPDGQKLAISGLDYGHPCNTTPGLTVVNLQEKSAQRIVAPPIASGASNGKTLIAGAHFPAWSPDGAWIAFGLDQESPALGPLNFSIRLYRVHPDGSDLTPLTNNATGYAADPAWAADGTLDYTLSRVSAEVDGIYHYNQLDNTHTRFISGSGLSSLSISPDGEFLTYREGENLKLWAFVRQEVIEVAPAREDSSAVFVGWMLSGR